MCVQWLFLNLSVFSLTPLCFLVAAVDDDDDDDGDDDDDDDDDDTSDRVVLPLVFGLSWHPAFVI